MLLEASALRTHAVVVVSQLEAREAQAVVGAHCVLTGTVSTVLPVTLVNICGGREKHSQYKTSLIETLQPISTSPSQTPQLKPAPARLHCPITPPNRRLLVYRAVWRLGCVLTHAHGLVRSGLEAIVTETPVAALRVDALAVAACVGDLLTLVAICGERESERER